MSISADQCQQELGTGCIRQGIRQGGVGLGGARRGVRWGGVLGLGVGFGLGVGAGLEGARRGIRWGGVLRGVLGAGVLGVVSSRYQAEH